MTDTYVVYECTNEVGESLYLGQTKSLRTRLSAHASGSTWWAECDRVTVIAEHRDRSAAQKSEAVFARFRQPRFGLTWGNVSPHKGKLRGGLARQILDSDLREPATFSEMQDMFAAEKSTLSRALRKLEDLGHITVDCGRDDARTRVIYFHRLREVA